MEAEDERLALGFAIRRATPEDSIPCHDLLWEAVTDLGVRLGRPLEGSADEWWRGSEPLHRYLALNNAEWWVAENPDSGRLIGYARSIARGGMAELTEFFVRPGEQSRGVGRALLDHAFPVGLGEVRSIIATTDVRALARYYTADTVVRFPFLNLAGQPAGNGRDGTLRAVSIGDDRGRIEAVAVIERTVLEYGRGVEEIEWLATQREGFLFQSDQDAFVGFAFIGDSGAGPIAVLDPVHLPEVLLHVEARARAMGLERLEFEVPAPNVSAILHLLGRGFRIDPWINMLMSNQPFGRFDRYIGYSPPVFL